MTQNDEIRDSFNKKGLLYSFLVSICWHVRICLAVYGPENRAVPEKESCESSHFQRNINDQ